ncbi:MAG: Fe2+-dependent dioxygenase [Steroidobacteraceae bacterium]
MITCIPDVLTPEELAKIRQEAARMPFVSGAATAGGRAKRVKNNEQVSQEYAPRRILHEIVINALLRNSMFQRVGIPKGVRPPLISRYRPGMSYGRHVDNAMMGPANARERSDCSITVFVSDQDEYDGGVLVIRSPFGNHEVKLPQGSAVIYPASTLHEVTEVTRGERLVCVTWAQSFVRDPQQREILANLAQIKDVMYTRLPDAMESDLVQQTRANLLRMWAET